MQKRPKSKSEGTTPTAAETNTNDEEAPLAPTPASPTSPTTTSSSSSSATSNPLKKYILPLLSNNDPNQPPDTILDFLKDSIIGIFFGVLAVSFLIFLDHHDILHLQSAHNFRETAYKLLNDPETLANLEESTEMKFITSSSYDAFQSELKDAQGKATKAQEKLAALTKEVEDRQAELGPLKEEYDTMYSGANLDLDKFCPECSWTGNISCQARAQYLTDTYNVPPLLAKVEMMKTPSCKKES